MSRSLEIDVPRALVTHVESGSIVLEGNPDIGRMLVELPYLSVILQVLASVDDPVFDRAAIKLSRSLQEVPVPWPLKTAGEFRLRTSESGQLVRVEPGARRKLESAVSEWGDVVLAPRGGGSEVWLIRRTGERSVALAARLDYRQQPRSAPGALKSDLAAALVRSVPSGAADVVLDPFAGSGVLALERARLPHAKLFATDIDPTLAAALRTNARKGAFGPNAITAQLDVRDSGALIDLLDGTKVNVVLSDPPWGLYQGSISDLDSLYDAAIANFRHILAPDGTVVLLTAAVQAASDSLERRGFELKTSFSVLVNGKKARVLVATVQDG